MSTYGAKIDNSPIGMYRADFEEHIKAVLMPYYQMNLETELIYLYEQNTGRTPPAAIAG